MHVFTTQTQAFHAFPGHENYVLAYRLWDILLKYNRDKYLAVLNIKFLEKQRKAPSKYANVSEKPVIKTKLDFHR